MKATLNGVELTDDEAETLIDVMEDAVTAAEGTEKMFPSGEWRDIEDFSSGVWERGSLP